MTLGKLMVLVMRLQADTRELAVALDEYQGWNEDLPGANAEHSASVVDSIAYSLQALRDTLHAEHQAACDARVARRNTERQGGE